MEKLASRGRFYNEDDLVAYDILDHDIDLVVDPERRWIEGLATVRLKTRAPLHQPDHHGVGRTADLSARSSATQFGWLFSLRVKNQNTLLVNLPMPLTRDTQITLRIAYGGRLSPQMPDRETLAPGQRAARSPTAESEFGPLRGSTTHRTELSLQQPQLLVPAGADQRLRQQRPCAFPFQPRSVAWQRGSWRPDSPTLVRGEQVSQNRKVYQFTATRPLRYLAFIVSRFTQAEQTTVTFDHGA